MEGHVQMWLDTPNTYVVESGRQIQRKAERSSVMDKGSVMKSTSGTVTVQPPQRRLTRDHSFCAVPNPLHFHITSS
jgi:hypothetical protein